MDRIKESRGWRVPRDRKVDRVSRLQLPRRRFAYAGAYRATGIREKYYYREYARFGTGLFVDDASANFTLLSRYLSGHYCVVNRRNDTRRERWCIAESAIVALQESRNSQRYLISIIVSLPGLAASSRNSPFLSYCWKSTYIAHKYPMNQDLPGYRYSGGMTRILYLSLMWKWKGKCLYTCSIFFFPFSSALLSLLFSPQNIACFGI